EVDDLVTELLDVAGVGDGQPHVGGEVVVTGGAAREDRGRVDVGQLGGVALLLEHVLPQLGGGAALLPAVEDCEAELALVLRGVGPLRGGVVARRVAGIARAAGEGGADGDGPCDDLEQTLVHVFLSRQWASPPAVPRGPIAAARPHLRPPRRSGWWWDGRRASGRASPDPRCRGPCAGRMIR